MGAPLRRIDSSVADLLAAEPYRFEFFQAVRVLLAMARSRSRGGESEDAPEPEAVMRFRTALSLAFPASEIQHVNGPATVDEAGSQAKWEMAVNFMGLVGPSGVLPHHYTERLLERRIYHRDTAAHGFLDMFSDRMITLFFGAWKKYRWHVDYELRPRHRARPLVASFFGMGMGCLQGRFNDGAPTVSVESMSYYAGLLVQRSRAGSNLPGMLEDYFGVPIRLEQFSGRWIELGANQTASLGSRNSALDGAMSIGARVWDRQTMATLTIGPLSREQFGDFLPGGRCAKDLKQILKLWSGMSLDYQIRLILRKEDVVPARIGGVSGSPPRLGWDGWMASREFERDADGAGYLIAG